MEIFWSQELFYHKASRKLSFKEIANIKKVSISTAKRRMKRDMENGYIKRERTTYCCKKYRVPLHGRNIYHTTSIGSSLLPQRSLHKKTLINESLLNTHAKIFLKSKFSTGCKHPFLKKTKKNLLKQLGFTHLEKQAPDWWFRNLTVLKKTLILLKMKQKRGYIVREEIKWISRCLKDSGRGYRYKKAKEISLAVAYNPLSPRNKWIKNSSQAYLDLLLSLTLLHRRGLNLSFQYTQTLLRKGAASLLLALSACLKFLKRNNVRNLNTFLNWIVSLKDPFEMFKKKRKKLLLKETIKEKKEREFFEGSKRAIENALESVKRDNRIDLFEYRKWREVIDSCNNQLHSQVRKLCYFKKTWKSETSRSFVFEIFFKENNRWVVCIVDPSKKNCIELFCKLWIKHLFFPKEILFQYVSGLVSRKIFREICNT